MNNADWLTKLERDRIPARRRQALHRERDAGEGIGEAPHRERRRHLVHRVQLLAAAGVRLPRAARSLRLHAADGRQRSVGQHHRRHGSDPPRARRQGARPGDAARDDGVGHEVRQDGGGHGLARSRAHVAVRVLSVLAQHRRSRRGAVSEVLHVPRRGRGSASSKRRARASRRSGTRSASWRAR